MLLPCVAESTYYLFHKVSLRQRKRAQRKHNRRDFINTMLTIQHRDGTNGGITTQNAVGMSSDFQYPNMNVIVSETFGFKVQGCSLI